MKFLFTLSLLLLVIKLFGQGAPGLTDIIVDCSSTVPVQKYRTIGLSYQTTRDKALSPLIFKGPGIYYSASSRKYRNKWLWQSLFVSQVHLLKNEPATSILNATGLSYQYAALRELIALQRGKWRFWAGPEVRIFLNMRLHSRNVNNVGTYDFATALGGSAMVSHQFSLWGRTFAISNQFQLPLLYLYARPPYAWGIPPAIFEEQDGSWKDAFQLGTLNNILFVANEVNVDFYLRKRKKRKLVQYKAYRLSYNWSYLQVNNRNSLQSGGHSLSLGRVITF